MPGKHSVSWAANDTPDLWNNGNARYLTVPGVDRLDELGAGRIGLLTPQRAENSLAYTRNLVSVTDELFFKLFSETFGASICSINRASMKLYRATNSTGGQSWTVHARTTDG